MGHGHVTPNPDGSKARCGGPALCSKCAQELARLHSGARLQSAKDALDPWESREREHLGKIADTGKAEAQPLSPEVWEAQQAELERLARRVAELTQYNGEKDERVRELVAVEKNLNARLEIQRAANLKLVEQRDEYQFDREFEMGQNETLKARVAELEENERKTLELLKDGHSAHILTLRGDIAISRRQMAHMLGDAYQELFAKLESGADALETPQKPPVCLQDPPVVVSGGDSASGYAGMPEYGRGFRRGELGNPLPDKSEQWVVPEYVAYREGWKAGFKKFMEVEP